jgi:Mor family transcriptional regulator
MTEPDTQDISDHALDIIEEEARAVAQCFGVPVPEDAASMIVDRIIARLAGSNIYIPKKSRRDRSRTRRLIRLRSTGNNIRELAREFNMSERWVRKIVNE